MLCRFECTFCKELCPQNQKSCDVVNMSVCIFHSQIPIPGHDRSDSTSSDPFPPSPSSLPSYQRKFSPPTSPRSPRAPRPPSPLLSDRRISGSARNSSPHSSTSSSPGDDGYLATATRQRSTSLKEKVRCISLLSVEWTFPY